MPRVITLLPVVALLAACATSSTTTPTPSASSSAATVSVADQEVAFCGQARQLLSSPQLHAAVQAAQRGQLARARTLVRRSLSDVPALLAAVPDSAPRSVRDAAAALVAGATQAGRVDPHGVGEVPPATRLAAYINNFCWGG